MTPKPAPRTVHHPHLAISNPVHTLRCSRALPSRRFPNRWSPFGAHLLFLRERTIIRVGSRGDSARLSAIIISSTVDGSLGRPSLSARTSVFAAALRARSRTPCDALHHARRHAAPAVVPALRRSLPRSWLRSPHNRNRLATLTFVRAAGWPRFVFVLRRHVMLAFTMLAFALVFRRSRSHPRSSRDVVHSCERPSSPPSRVHTSGAPCGANKARSPSRARLRARLSTLTAGRTPSAHSPRAREFVSRFDGSELRSSFCSRTAAPCRTRQSRSCSPFDDHDRVAVRDSSEPNTSCDMSCPMKPSRAFA
jgi:hypothetical protein